MINGVNVHRAGHALLRQPTKMLPVKHINTQPPVTKKIKEYVVEHHEIMAPYVRIYG